MKAPHLQQIHSREREFFDAKARQQEAGYVDRRMLHRYSGRLHSYIPHEFAMSLAGDLNGKSVLDVGCGDGSKSVLFARLGAAVTGVDISSGSIDVARRRAARNRVSVEFKVSPIEQLAADQYFDVVWVEALLHHLLHDLDAQIAKLASVVAPGGIIIIKEPVSLSPAMRRLRLRFGPPPDATPDERPLEPADIDIIRRHLPGMQMRVFSFAGRMFTKLVLRGRPLEYTSILVRAGYHGAHIADRCLFGLPGVSAAASSAVMWCRRSR